MLKIFKIAKLEISILFYSPVAWLVLTIFMIQSGIGFFGMFQGLREALSMGSHMNDLTFAIFPGLNGLFDKVLQTLYLYIPLLTMGLMSRETSSGSIKLLLSSPVKIKQIILGKYLAMVVYCTLLMLILTAYSILGAVLIKDADITLILSGLTGLFLLTCTYAAIGLFMSCLTSYQVVAAISTLAVFAVLRFVGNIGQEINFVRDLTYFLSISGRADDMLKGLITTKDVLYFILIIVLFLWLCILRLQSGTRTGKYVLLFSATLLLGYISSRPALTGYLDMTATKNLTLTENSRAVARQIKGPLRITTYVNLLDQNVYAGLPVSRNTDHARFEQYQRFIPGLEMDYVYYYDVTDLKDNSNMIYQGDLTGLSTKQIAEKVADNMGIDLSMFMPPAEIRKRINLQPEDNNLVRVLTYKGKSSWLRLYNEMDQFPGEAEITAAIKRLLAPVPVVAFITGNNERSIDKKGDRNYQLISTEKKNRHSLINQGFDVISIDLDKDEIPDSLAALVLADPATPLSDLSQHKITAYLRKGGNMLITGEPGRQSLLNPVLEQLGVHMKEGMLVNPNKDDTPDKLYSHRVVLPTAAALEYDTSGGFRADTLLSSPATGWNKPGPADLTTTDVKYGEGDQKAVFPIALSLEKNKQKIVISGDADFMSNVLFSSNYRFSMALFNWFTDGSFPIDVSRVATTDDAILVKRKEIYTLQLIFLGIIPLLIISLGVFTLVSRKRK
ncbi:ABC transporter permease subunit [Chitinophaga oryziterrae]|uniref:ABC transporter permease subunit n=1 Tax=Chitinophaga oryziterrae TaxID=1031224 RepID=A0A6N8JI29_9BACT|nr:Gldg family protein [Chitinophaga oryziterrae]MVT43996.1 ABC transporter permease subunit [Chitinophaga oryziterrae]